MRNDAIARVICDECGGKEDIHLVTIDSEGVQQAVTRILWKSGWYTNWTKNIDVCYTCLNGIMLEKYGEEEE